MDNGNGKREMGTGIGSVLFMRQADPRYWHPFQSYYIALSGLIVCVVHAMFSGYLPLETSRRVIVAAAEPQKTAAKTDQATV